MSVHDARNHKPDCDWHLEQYPWECTCGLLAAPIKARRGETREAGLDAEGTRAGKAAQKQVHP